MVYFDIMKITETERTYAFEITQRQMLKLLKRDDVNLHSRGTLLHRLLALPAVRQVEYDPMMGCVIFCRIEVEGQTIADLLDCVKKEIMRYVR